MKKLDPKDYGRVLPLVEATPFNVLMARAVLDGDALGTVWVDSISTPRACYIRHQYGMSYLLGHTEDSVFRSELDRYLVNGTGDRTEPEYLQVHPEGWHRTIEPQVKLGTITQWGRSNFSFDRDRFADDRFANDRFTNNRFANDCTATTSSICPPADRAQIESFTGAVIPARFWKTLDHFMRHGIAYHHGDPDKPRITTALAFSSYRDTTHLEIGIETAPPYRGRGHARAACRALIRYCLETNLKPVWSCRTENTSSYHLANALGFQESTRHPFYQLPAVPNESPG